MGKVILTYGLSNVYLVLFGIKFRYRLGILNETIQAGGCKDFKAQ